jgi:hypothetical protein
MTRLVTAVLLLAGIAATASAREGDQSEAREKELRARLGPAGPQQPEPFASPANQAARAKQLTKDIKTFRLELNYNSGPVDKAQPTFYRLVLSVPPIVPPLPRPGERGTPHKDPFCLSVQISEEQAGKIIDHLQPRLLWIAQSRNQPRKLPLNRPGYSLEVGNYSMDLIWGQTMLGQLDGLRDVLDGKAAKDMDVLIGRMSGLRKQWQKEAEGGKPVARAPIN